MEVSEADERRDREAAQRRVLQAAALLELFRRSHQREPATADELRCWASANAVSVPGEPSAILTSDQMLDALHDCLRGR